MTKRDELRVEKALQGLEFPTSHDQLLDFATDRAADRETLAALRALPAGQYANKEDVLAALPQEPEGGDAPGGTSRG